MPPPCLWDNIEIGILCYIVFLHSVYSQNWQCIVEINPWQRGYPLRIQLVKYVVWLRWAICEHEGKAACECVAEEFANPQISNKDDGDNLREMSQECDNRWENRKLMNCNVPYLERVWEEWDCHPRKHSSQAPQDACTLNQSQICLKILRKLCYNKREHFTQKVTRRQSFNPCVL